MPYLNDEVRDQGLDWAAANGSRLEICSQEPTSAAEVTTYSLGHRDGITVGAPADAAGGGRGVEIPAVTDGTVTATGTATHWALWDGAGTLVAAGGLAASQAVTSGNTWTTPAGTIRIADAVSE